MKKNLKILTIVAFAALVFGCKQPAGTNTVADTINIDEVGSIATYVTTYVSSEEQVAEVLKEIFPSFSINTKSRAINNSAKNQLTKIVKDINEKAPTLIKAYTEIMNGNLPSGDINLDEEIKLDSITVSDAVDTVQDVLLSAIKDIEKTIKRSIPTTSIEKSFSNIKKTLSKEPVDINIKNLLLKFNIGYSAANKTLNLSTNDKVKVTAKAPVSDIDKTAVKGVGGSISYAIDYSANMEEMMAAYSMKTNNKKQQQDMLNKLTESITNYNLNANANVLLAVATSKKIGGYFNINVGFNVPKEKLLEVLSLLTTASSTTDYSTYDSCFTFDLSVKDEDGKTTFSKKYTLSELITLLN